MRSRFRSESSPKNQRKDGALELVRVRGPQRDPGHEGRALRRSRRRRGTRGRRRGGPPPAPPREGPWTWLRRLLRGGAGRPLPSGTPEADHQVCREFCRHYQIPFGNVDLLALALTHRSYMQAGGAGTRESNERLEFLGDSVLGLVVTEHLYQKYPGEHEGQLTKTKSLLVSKAILSRRALAMGLGRYVLMSQSEVESGGRQRLSILADAFEAVIGAIYLDLGYEPAQVFIERWLLRDTRAILSDKRHTNYKSQLQEYVQSTFHTHPIYHIRSEMGPDHSKVFMVEVLVGRRVLGEGKGRNKKEAEQAAARDALERSGPGERDEDEPPREARAVRPGGVASRARGEARGRERAGGGPSEAPTRERAGGEPSEGRERERRRRRRGGRGRRERGDLAQAAGAAAPIVPGQGPEHVAETPAPPPPVELEPAPSPHEEDDLEEVGRPEPPLPERQVDPYAWDDAGEGARSPAARRSSAEPRTPEARGLKSEEAEPGGAVGEDAPAPEEDEQRPAPSGPSQAAPLYGRRPPRARPPFRR